MPIITVSMKRTMPILLICIDNSSLEKLTSTGWKKLFICKYSNMLLNIVSENFEKSISPPIILLAISEIPLVSPAPFGLPGPPGNP